MHITNFEIPDIFRYFCYLLFYCSFLLQQIYDKLSMFYWTNHQKTT